jgi:hypothetical protein
VSRSGPFVQAVADELPSLGLEVFVAPTGIAPATEWVEAIEVGLQSSSALVAFIEPGFRESEWTDQEIGYALGRNQKIVPLLRGGAVPHGFLARIQGVRIDSMLPREVSVRIFDTLYQHADERRALEGVVVTLLERERRAERLDFWLRRFETHLPLHESTVAALRSMLADHYVLRTHASCRRRCETILASGGIREQ